MCLERFVYRRADHIVVVTGGWTDHFKALGISDDKVSVIANGVDVDKMVVTEPSERLRAEFGFPQDRLTAIYAGAHGPANGLDQLLDAAAELRDVDIVLIGAGTERDRLIELVESRKISNVRFMEPVPKAELARVLAACDIGIHILAPWDLLQQGLSPNKLFDYMAAGLPVVSNCAPGLQAVIADGECGRLSQPDDFTAALRAVAAASPEERRRWGATGRAIVAERFSRTAAADRLSELLASVDRRNR
jgi:glycosyltransferase involved in cell wall biosynthesis